jgi:sarcosine oxidase
MNCGDKLVICAGAWGAKLVPELAALAVPERQVLTWFQPSQPSLFRLQRFQKTPHVPSP